MLLAPGDYQLGRFQTLHAGSTDQPIRVKAQSPSETRILTSENETFVIHHSHWHFINLTLIGNQASEHAFHISGDADYVLIQSCHLQNFDNHIKANGTETGFPDNLTIEGCELFNERPRSGRKPSSPIDIIGSSNVNIRNNYLHDFGNDLDGGISYGMFLKGRSNHGRIEQNLIVCADKHQGIRAGISLGGGGTAPQFCADSRCDYEHQNGLISNNIITNCTDAGIHLRNAKRSQIITNTLLFTAGIDIDPGNSSATLYRNYIGGTVNQGKGATVRLMGNRITGSNWSIYHPKIHRWLEQPLPAVPRWLQNSPLGLGHEQVRQDFHEPEKLDLTPTETTHFTAPPASPPNLQLPAQDYRGNPRGKTPWIGALDYDISSPVVLKNSPVKTQ
ncbi:right-handed parallel beta-helix repeat-containing protein [Motiliproteus sp.]|uniref:right-handed parallel beta-helix repeat-containing protein n=1 Tax=Motiliproteus sp. TaxID=1898955 RepID=UPI003BAB7B83